jgi:hypothetical protein
MADTETVRWVIRHKGTGLLLQQHLRTARVIGWTGDPYSCRCYRSMAEAEAEIARGHLTSEPLAILPLSAFL